MKAVKEFKKWKSERMSYPLPVLLACDAVEELENIILNLESHCSSLCREIEHHGYGDSENISNFKNFMEHNK